GIVPIHVRALAIVLLAGVVIGAPAVRLYAPGCSDRSESPQKRFAYRPRGRTRVSVQLAPQLVAEQIRLIDPPRRMKVEADPTSRSELTPSAPRLGSPLVARSDQSRLPLRC